MTAQDRVDFLLDELDQVYPDSRKTAIRQRMQDFWAGKMPQDRFPYAAMEYGAPCTDFPSDAAPAQRDLICRLHNLVQHGKRWQDDHYPALSMDIRQVNLPSYFGCVEEFASKSVRVRPEISDPEDVYNLPRTHFAPGTAGCETLDTLALWRKMTRGRVSFFEPDMQGPFSTASQVWGVEDFLLACYESPEEVQYLIDQSCDAVLEFTQKMTDAVEGDMLRFHCHPCLWYPIEKGLAVSEDLVAVVSPKISEQFMVEPLTRIARETGGVCVHTCGSMNHTIPVLCQVPGLMALNFSSAETNVAQAMEQKRKDVRLVVHNGLLATPGNVKLSPLEHIRHMGELSRAHQDPIFTIFLNFEGDVTPDMDAAYQACLKV